MKCWQCLVGSSTADGLKVKEVDLYSAFIVVPHTQGAQVRITHCYLQITLYLPLPRKHSPEGASPDWGCGHLIAAYYSFIYPERTKGWVSLVYPRKWLPVSCRSSAEQRKLACQRPTSCHCEHNPVWYVRVWPASEIQLLWILTPLCDKVKKFWRGRGKIKVK